MRPAHSRQGLRRSRRPRARHCQIVDDDDRGCVPRRPTCRALAISRPTCAGRLRRASSGRWAEHRRKACPDRAGIRPEQLAGPGVELRERRLSVVLTQDAGIVAHDLHERPVGDAGAIRKAPTAEHLRALRPGDTRERFADEPRLADTRIAGEREDVGPPLIAHALECVEQHPGARAGRRAAPASRGPPGLLEDRAPGAHRAERLDQLDLAFAAIGSRAACSIADRVGTRSADRPTTSPISAPCCRRAATFTASPVTRRNWQSSPPPATASHPYSTPTRAAQRYPELGVQVRSSRRASRVRHGRRSASSSCGVGPRTRPSPHRR